MRLPRLFSLVVFVGNLFDCLRDSRNERKLAVSSLAAARQADGASSADRRAAKRRRRNARLVSAFSFVLRDFFRYWCTTSQFVRFDRTQPDDG